MRRHPELSRRRAQAFERSRASAMNLSTIKHYFLLLAAAFAQIKELSGGMPLEPDRIWNMDEIGFQLNAVRPYIVTRRGAKHAASISFMSRVTTSLAVSVSANGFVQAPFFIVRGQRKPPDFLKHAPPKSSMSMALKGMMTDAVFQQWVQHFIANMPPRDPKHWSLLLLDGHHSHTMNPEVLKLLSDNRIYVLALPSHTTAALQLLDVAVFGPLKRAFRQYLEQWKSTNPLGVLDRNQLPMIVNEIWDKGIQPENIRKGARSTGLYPLDPNWAANNAHRFKIAQVFHQQTIPGTISFAQFSGCHRSLSALDLALSPPQEKDLFQRLMSHSRLPRLNGIGENLQEARALNSKQRLDKLFSFQDKKIKEMKEKAEKKRARAEKRQKKQLEKAHKQSKQLQVLEAEKPLIDALTKAGFHSGDKAPTVAVMKSFAKKQRIKGAQGSREKIVSVLLGAIKKNGERDWLREEDKEAKESESESEDELEVGEESEGASEDSCEDWSEWNIVV
jgi:hypothetical protein